MSRFVVFCTLLAFITVAEPLASISNEVNDVDSISFGVPNSFELQRSFDVSKTYGARNPFEVQDSSGWQKIFSMEDIPDPKEPTQVKDLFSSIKLTAVPSTQVGGIIRYTTGKRISNDRLVGTGSGSKRWAVPQDVTLALRYPSTGDGAIVTYVEIVVNQSSNVGQAQVISGGIGHRFITIAVEAKNTMWFSYTASIYGM